MYIEKQPKTWSYICIGLYLAGITAMGVKSIPQDTGTWLLLSALFLVLVLLPFLAVPISKFVYHRIRIDPALGTLRVGREVIALADLDPASVQAARAEAPSPRPSATRPRCPPSTPPYGACAQRTRASPAWWAAPGASRPAWTPSSSPTAAASPSSSPPATARPSSPPSPRRRASRPSAVAGGDR